MKFEIVGNYSNGEGTYIFHSYRLDLMNKILENKNAFIVMNLIIMFLIDSVYHSNHNNGKVYFHHSNLKNLIPEINEDSLVKALVDLEDAELITFLEKTNGIYEVKVKFYG